VPTSRRCRPTNHLRLRWPVWSPSSSKGYSVTIAEAREHLKAKAAANGKVLSDAELDGAAGGSTPMYQTKEFWGTPLTF
jgi:hypothetical protein